MTLSTENYLNSDQLRSEGSPNLPMPPETTSTLERSPAHSKPVVEHGAKAKHKGGLIASGAVVALALLFVVDASARTWLKTDNYAQPNTSWAWWITKSARESGRANIAILGSSLMVATVVDSDATFKGKVLDQVTHHRSLLLEELLKQRTGKTLRTQSFAVGGQMASDAYAITRVLLSGDRKPDYIVWGIAPRDFVDATFLNPNSSETVHYMNKVAGGKDVLGLRKSVNQRLEDGYSWLFHLYNQRGQILIWQQNLTVALLKSFGWHEPEPSSIPKELKNWAAETLPENEPQAKWNVGPFTHPAPIVDNSKEYIARYQPFKPQIYSSQLKYFEDFLQYCKENKIKVLLFNMPITPGNQSLLPPTVYDNYKRDTKTLATKYGAKYVDLNTPGSFQTKDFSDTVHMNGFGGIKFWDKVADNWD